MDVRPNEEWRSKLCQLMQLYGWGLVSCETLWTAMIAERPDGFTSETDLKHVARLCYGPILHAACLATATPADQEQAFREIYQYSYRLFAGSYQTEVNQETLEELAQETIFTVHRRLDECQSPKTFLRFIYFQFRTVDKEYQRAKERFPAMAEADLSELAESQQPADPAAEIRHELIVFRDCLGAALARLKNEKMRLVIIATYEEGLSSNEIANKLQLTSNNVNVLRSRGLTLLRDDDELQRCLDEA